MIDMTGVDEIRELGGVRGQTGIDPGAGTGGRGCVEHEADLFFDRHLLEEVFNAVLSGDAAVLVNVKPAVAVQVTKLVPIDFKVDCWVTIVVGHIQFLGFRPFSMISTAVFIAA